MLLPRSPHSCHDHHAPRIIAINRLAGWRVHVGGATFVVSTSATTSLEDIAKVATRPLWFQLYVQPDREYTRELVRRAEATGCHALIGSPVVAFKIEQETRKPGTG